MPLAVRRAKCDVREPQLHAAPHFSHVLQRKAGRGVSQTEFLPSAIVFDLTYRRPILSGKVWRLYGQQIR
jgi:hypothetical protein